MGHHSAAEGGHAANGGHQPPTWVARPPRLQVGCRGLCLTCGPTTPGTATTNPTSRTWTPPPPRRPWPLLGICPAGTSAAWTRCCGWGRGWLGGWGCGRGVLPKPSSPTPPRRSRPAPPPAPSTPLTPSSPAPSRAPISPSWRSPREHALLRGERAPDRDLQGGQCRCGVGDPLRHVGRCSPGAADHAVASAQHSPSVAVVQMFEGWGMVNHMPM